jgi:hypothetical protein
MRAREDGRINPTYESLSGHGPDFPEGPYRALADARIGVMAYRVSRGLDPWIDQDLWAARIASVLPLTGSPLTGDSVEGRTGDFEEDIA